MSGSVAINHPECGESAAAESYIIGALSPADRDRYEQHFFECPVCAEAIRDLSSLRTGIRTGLCPPSESVPARRPAPLAWRPALAWLQPLVAAAALAVAVFTGYQNVQLRNQLRPAAVQALTLQPATRGELPVAPSPTAGGFLLVEADLPGASGILTWTVQERNGGTKMHGTAEAPDPGLLFRLLLPASGLPPADYTLNVVSNQGRTWEFHFRAAAR